MSSVLAGQASATCRRRPGCRGPSARLLLRGLARDPDRAHGRACARCWPSWPEFARPPARRTWAIAAGVAAALLGGGIGMAYRTGALDGPCSGADARLATVWNDEVQSRLAEVARTSGVAEAEAAGARSRGVYGGRGGVVAHAYGEACRQKSAEQLDLRMTCLAERRGPPGARRSTCSSTPTTNWSPSADELTASLPRIDAVQRREVPAGRRCAPPEDGADQRLVTAARPELARAVTLESSAGASARRWTVLRRRRGGRGSRTGYLGAGRAGVPPRLGARERRRLPRRPRGLRGRVLPTPSPPNHQEVAIDRRHAPGLRGRPPPVRDAFASRDWLQARRDLRRPPRRSDPPRPRADGPRGDRQPRVASTTRPARPSPRRCACYHEAGEEDTIDFAQARCASTATTSHQHRRDEGRHPHGEARALAGMRAEARAAAPRRGDDPQPASAWRLARGRPVRARASGVRGASTPRSTCRTSATTYRMTAVGQHRLRVRCALQRSSWPSRRCAGRSRVLERSSDRLLGDTYDMHNTLGMLLLSWSARTSRGRAWRATLGASREELRARATRGGGTWPAQPRPS